MANRYNFGPPPLDFSAAFAGINKAIDNLGRQQQLGNLGAAIKDKRYDDAAGIAIGMGDTSSGLGFLKLGQAAQNRTLEQQASDDLARAVGSNGASDWRTIGNLATPASGSGSSISDLAPSLIQNESGGNFRAQNDAVGHGGQRGHFGRAQFGQARIADAIKAGALPPGTTPQAFMQSPQLQQQAERWHVADIDRNIQANGFDRLVGRSINGVPITIDGLRAVAHLGGVDGMRRFVETGGRHDPADINGTRLSDYFARHGGAGGAGAADRPAPGAAHASVPGSGSGFAVPGEPRAMDGRTFDAITAGAGAQPLQPAFQSEGVSQPWMNSALHQEAPQASRATAMRSPARPLDPRADRPGPGTVPAIGQMAGANPPDLSNAPDAGAKEFVMMAGANANPITGAFHPAAQGGQSAGASWANQPAGQPQAPMQPVRTADMPRPTTREEAMAYHGTRTVERAEGKLGELTKALMNPRLPANARALGQIFLKDVLDNAKAPDSVKEFMWARANGMTTARSPADYQKEKARVSPLEATNDRRAAAEAVGLRPGDPGYQNYLLTGAMPRGDAGPMSASDKKAVLEADEGVMAAETAIKALTDAKRMSPRANTGMLAGARAAAGNMLPDIAVPDWVSSKESSQATAELENVVTSQALAQLKSIFGAAPTEGERKILMEIQGSIGQPDSVRQAIYDRGIAMAQRRLEFNRQRAAELRGGTYYRPEGQRGQGAQPAPQQSAPQQGQSPPQGARQAPDGNFYVPDPNRPGKYLRVQ